MADMNKATPLAEPDADEAARLAQSRHVIIAAASSPTLVYLIAVTAAANEILAATAASAFACFSCRWTAMASDALARSNDWADATSQSIATEAAALAAFLALAFLPINPGPNRRFASSGGEHSEQVAQIATSGYLLVSFCSFLRFGDFSSVCALPLK
jgi:hypothetical protein